MEGLNAIFMDAEETEAAVLGEYYVNRFIKEGILKCGFCVLTDKRVYFKGRYLQKNGRSYQTNNGEYTIDLKDITGSGFATTRFGIIFLLEILAVIIMTVLTGLFLLFVETVEHYQFGMASILWSCKIQLALGLAAVPIFYYLKPFKIFVIEYISGKIAFLAFDYLEEDMRMFQRELYKVKDGKSSDAPQQKDTSPALQDFT